MTTTDRKRPMPKTLGDLLRELRLARGLTLRQLADLVGVSAPFVSDLERGRRGTSRLADFARALDVSEELLALADGRLDSALARWLASEPRLLVALRQCQRLGVSAPDVLAALYQLPQARPRGHGLP